MTTTRSTSRRNFLSTTALVAAAVVVAPSVVAEPSQLRVEVSEDGETWVHVPAGLRAVRDGQFFRMFHPLTGDPMDLDPAGSGVFSAVADGDGFICTNEDTSLPNGGVYWEAK
jgi:hypothetical protein